MKLRVLAMALIGAALSACVGPRYVTSDVTRFHTLPASPSGQTFAIVAVDKDQEQSLAFRQYADMLNAGLTQVGLRQFTGEAGKPDYVVTLTYNVEGPSPDVRTRNFSVNMGYGYWGRHWGLNGAYDPWGSSYSTTDQVYSRRVNLDIYKGTTWGTPNPEKVFEGRALSEGQNGQIEPVMPYIIDAFFKEFPGASGSTRTVRVEVPVDSDVTSTATNKTTSRSSM